MSGSLSTMTFAIRTVILRYVAINLQQVENWRVRVMVIFGSGVFLRRYNIDVLRNGVCRAFRPERVTLKLAYCVYRSQ